MLYTLKMSKEEINDIIDILNKHNERHIEGCEKYGVKENGLYYVNKLVNYLQEELDLQDRQLQDKLIKG